MKLYSKYLNEDVESTSFNDNGEDICIISHNTLERCIYNAEKCIEKGVVAGYTTICSEPGHYAVLCRISDKNGRSIECVGESMLATLKTQIAKDYPMLMAVKRAFDDAAIKFLDFPKAYSDQQIQSPKQPTQSAEIKAPAPSPKPAPAPVAPAPAAANTPVAAPASAPAVESGIVKENDERFSKVITFGKNRGKTLNELWPNNAADINWLAWDLKPSREETSYWQKAAQDFLKMKEV